MASAKVPWINQRGHLGLPAEAQGVRPVLAAIFAALGGEIGAQAAKRKTPLPGDFVEPDTGTFIEIDEIQHFTSFRALSLRLYPPAASLGFDPDVYLDLCARWAPRSDRYRAAKSAVGFGQGGRQRQRAYHDALRDLAAPALGHPAVIRVPVLDCDGAAAWRRERDRIHQLLDAASET